jgi:ribosomal protein S18 acetylase RimI-like enzyme
MIVRRATLEDLDTILAWRAEAIAWLAKRGIDQWTYPTDPPYPTRERAIETIIAGQTWMVWDHSTPAATLTLTGYIDPELWDIVGDPENALYLHKLTVPRTRAGVGLGAELLDWAAGRAHDQGLSWLRLDAWTTNTHLQDYYLRHGFQHVHTVATRPSGACYQRPTQPYAGTRVKTDD